jgi:ketosteroid isomerase-like protein
VHGDVAFTRSIQHISATGSSGKSMDFVCRVTDVLEKRDGRWVIVQEHSSVPVDVFGAGKADLLSRP